MRESDGRAFNNNGEDIENMAISLRSKCIEHLGN